VMSGGGFVDCMSKTRCPSPRSHARPGVGLRTLRRWQQIYRAGGIAALDVHPRADAETRRTPAATVSFIERLALTKPRPTIATLHRLAAAEALRHERPEPSYAAVRDIVADGRDAGPSGVTRTSG
jgi:hypothetical protein